MHAWLTRLNVSRAAGSAASLCIGETDVLHSDERTR